MSECPHCLKPVLTLEHANEAARRGCAKDHHSRAYRCPVGNGWHVGTSSCMNKLASLFPLATMRRRGGASVSTSRRWAAGLLWRNHQTAHRRRAESKRAGFERH